MTRIGRTRVRPGGPPRPVGWATRAVDTLPGIVALREYQRAWLRDDLVAGLVLAALLVPQGMAYAQLAGLPPVTGLYTTVVALGGYALFGPSRILVLGPDSALAPLIGAAVIGVAGANTEDAVAAAGVLAILTGLVCVVAGLLRLGAITELLSKPVRVGYLNGLAVVMFVGQLPVLFGFDTGADGVAGELEAFVRNVADDMSGPTLTVGLGALILILVLRRAAPAVPAVLVAVSLATVVVGVFDLAGEGVEVIGGLPSGFPSPTVPTVDRADLGELAIAAVAIAVVAFADTSALSSTLGRSVGIPRPTDSLGIPAQDPNREAVGLGAANLAAGFFQGFPVSASTTRTVVATSVGARTQLTGVVGGVVVMGVVAFGDRLVRNLPVTVLAAVIIVAAISLLDVGTLRWLRAVRPSEFGLSLIATAGVVLFGVFEGIAVAVALSLAAFIWRSWRPHDAVLGRVDNVKGYHDVARHPEASRIPGLVVFRFDAPLFFANAQHFRRRVDQLLAEGRGRVRWLVLAAEPMTDIDSSGAEVLVDLVDELASRDIRLAFAELKGPVKDRLDRYGLLEQLGPGTLYPTLGTAIDAYLAATGVDWRDWTDRR